MNKNIQIILGIIVLVLIGWFFVNQNQTKIKVDESIKVGIMIALTGDLANYGEGMLDGIKMATDEVNSDIEKFKLIVEDSPCDPAKAVSIANKLINIDKVNVIVGPVCSGELLAINNLANEKKIIVLSPSATAPDVKDAGDYIFRNVVSDDLKAKVFAEYLFNEKDVRELAVLAVNIDAAIGFEKSFTNKFEELGGKVVMKEIYPQGLADARTQLTKIKEAKLENLLLMGFPAEMGTVIKQVEELDLNIQIYSGFEGIDDPQTVEIAGDSRNGVISIYQKTPDKDFAIKYKDIYQVEPLVYVAESYDAIKLLEIAIKDGINPEKIKNNLYTIENYEGVSGNITFDENGDVIKPFVINIMQNGELVEL